MQANPEQRLVGTFSFEVCGSGRHGRQHTSQFSTRCDAIGLHNSEILLLSVAGPETSVKALTAGPRGSGNDQKRIDYSVHLGDVHSSSLLRCPNGYRLYRSKLDYGLWHVLCLAKRDGFMPVLSHDAVWQLLHSDRFTTPLLREWMPWLHQRLKYNNEVVELTQAGCQAGFLSVTNDRLDHLVSEGLTQQHLRIGGELINWQKLPKPIAAKTLDDYMLTYGPLLGKQAEHSLQPLHVPGRWLSRTASASIPRLCLWNCPSEAFVLI